jgi:predicted thioesterase
MTALMEGACVAAVDHLLPEGFATVGTELAIKHSAASPLGMEVRAEGELLELNGRELVFRVAAFDKAGMIGEGTHRRFIIDTRRFLKKLEERGGK